MAKACVNTKYIICTLDQAHTPLSAAARSAMHEAAVARKQLNMSSPGSSKRKKKSSLKF